MDDFQSCIRLHGTLSTQGRAALANELRKEPATSAQAYADLTVGLGERHAEYERVQRSDSVQDARERYLRLFYNKLLAPERTEPSPENTTESSPPPQTIERGESVDDDKSEVSPVNDEESGAVMESREVENVAEKYAKLAYRIRGSQSDYDAVLKATTEKQAREIFASLKKAPAQQQEEEVPEAMPPAAGAESMAGHKTKVETFTASGQTIIGVMSVVSLFLLCMLLAMFAPWGQSTQQQATQPANVIKQPSDKD